MCLQARFFPYDIRKFIPVLLIVDTFFAIFSGRMPMLVERNAGRWLLLLCPQVL
jgi:hypothetical protein